MKKIILLGILPVFISSGNPQSLKFEFKEEPIILEPKPIDNLINALIEIESRGNDSAIGDRHLVGNEAVGALQIRPIMVKEVNRILRIQKSERRFDLKDRFDKNKSIEMFLIWKNFHHKNSDAETIARNWNGGPNGYKTSRTVKYWNKVEQQLNKANG